MPRAAHPQRCGKPAGSRCQGLARTSAASPQALWTEALPTPVALAATEVTNISVTRNYNLATLLASLQTPLRIDP